MLRRCGLSWAARNRCRCLGDWRWGGCTRCPHRDGRLATAILTLDCQDHVVLSTQLQPRSAPCFEVSPGVDRPTRSLRLADRPELREGGGTLDRWFVLPDLGANLIFVAILGEVALELGLGIVRAWPVIAIIVDDVVLYKRARRPSVKSEVSVALGFEDTRKANIPRGLL
jgi:hypothetical protein